MFDFLQKLSHQHQRKQKAEQQNKEREDISKNNQSKIDQNNSVERQESTRVKQNVKKAKKLTSLSAQLQMGQSAELDPQVLHILQQIRDESESQFTGHVLQMINQERAKIERKVYLREMSHNFQQYLQQILTQCSSPNRFVRHGLAEIVDHVANSVFDDILYTNKYQIAKKSGMTKDELALLQKSLSHIKNNEGSIRDKVGELKLQLKNESQKIHDKSLQIISKHSFSINHPKTKQVQSFLKSIQLQRMQQRMRYQNYLQEQKAKKRQKQEIMEIARQKAKSERHERLVQAYQIKRKIKQQQKSMAAKREEQFNQYVKVYRSKVPLFKQKEKQYVENFVKKQQEQIYNKLLKRQQNYAPLSLEQLEDHEQKYMDYKRDNRVRQRQQIRMQKQLQKRRLEEIQKFHKGQFRYKVLSQMLAKKQEKDPKQQLIQKKIRQLAYSQNVKQSYKPKIDPMKKFQMESLLKSSQKNRRKYRSPNRVQSTSLIQSNSYHRSYDNQDEQRDPKKQGQRNRRYFKQFIRQKIEKGQIRKKTEQKRPSTISPKQDYLQQLRSQRQKNGRKYETIDDEIKKIKQKQDVAALIAKVDHHDKKARRLQQKFRYAMHKPEEQASLQDNYLFSIKAKLQLLNNYD